MAAQQERSHDTRFCTYEGRHRLNEVMHNNRHFSSIAIRTVGEQGSKDEAFGDKMRRWCPTWAKQVQVMHAGV